MREQILVFASMFMLSLPAHAHVELIGENVKSAKEKDYPYLCQFEISGGDMDYICSGTLISPTEILTAAHCFGLEGKDANPRVYCGGRSMGRVTGIKLPEAKYWRNRETTFPEHDVAVVTLKKPTQQATLNYSHEQAEFFNQDGSLKEGVQCKIAGFGLDDYGHAGSLLIADPKDVYFHFQGNAIYMSPLTTYLMTSADHGDSGGALMCTDLLGVTKLVGITQSYSIDQTHQDDRERTQNLFAAPWINL